MSGLGEKSAIEIVRDRRDRGSLPSRREDDFKVGAAFDSGCMRGLIPMSMATVFEILGYRESLDAIYGSSAGAIVGAYTASAQTEDGLRAYLYDVPCKEFINVLRPLRGKTIVDMHYLIDGVLKGSAKLDWEKVRDSNIPLSVTSISAKTNETEVFDSFSEEKDVFGAIYASAWMPWFAGIRPFVHKGKRYWDGAAADPTGVEAALKNGCTHVLSFRSDNKYLHVPSLRYADNLVDEIVPESTISRLEKNPRKLKHAIKIGAWAVMKAMNAEQSEVELVRKKMAELAIEI